MKLFFKWLFIIWLVSTAILGILYWPMVDQWIRFNPSVSAADFQPPSSPLEAQSQDFQYLKSILDYDRSFSPQARKEFIERMDGLVNRSHTMSNAQFFLETHALMALADNAHTSGDSVALFRQFNRSGIDFYEFSDGIYAVRAHQSLKSLLGQKLISIEGLDIPTLMDKLSVYRGGPASQKTLNALFVLRSPALLHAANLAASPDELSLVLEDKSGLQNEIKLTAIPPAAETEFSYRHPYHTLLDRSLSDEENEWVRVLDGDNNKAPMTLKDDGDLVFTKNIEEGIYVRSNYLVEYPGHEVKSQLVEALANPPEKGFPFIIIDLRWNPGGDLGNAIPFAKRIGESLSTDGKAYVIVGPQTFSAAIVTAALVKQYAGENTMILGESMGDRPQFWAERGGAFILPNSGYHIAYSTGYHDWEKGCTSDAIEHCFPPVEREASNIGSLVVDPIIQPTLEQYAAGQDPVLQWILEQTVE